jgi:hypothetical protein
LLACNLWGGSCQLPGNSASDRLKFRSKEHDMTFSGKKRPPSSSVAALVLARAMQQVAQDRDDAEMWTDAIDYENRALAAIRLHLSVLPEREKPAAVQLRFLGF